MDPIFELQLDRAPKGFRGSAQLLFRQLEAAINDGRLPMGAQLPATRKSRACFGVSRNTCANVYEKLHGAGYVASRHGSGTYVVPRPPAMPAPPAIDDEADERLNPLWLGSDVASAMGFWREPSARASVRPAVADFRPALVDPQLFPYDVYRRVSAKQLRSLERKPASLRSPQGNQGGFALRAAITQHIALTRAIACRAEDVLVTSGAQQAFDLLARILVKPGETIVAVEDPGYPPMRVPFLAAGARLVPVPVDEEGIIVDRLPPGTGVICVTPSHQFPLGMAMSPSRRRALIDFAEQRGAVIVEDDYDGEFRYEGSPLEALKAADAPGVVFYVGTFSKCMLPLLRLGFVVAPGWAMRALVAAKNALDWHCSTPLQMTVAAFISEGHLARHVRKLREHYGQRRNLLRRHLEGRLGEWLEAIPSFYGTHAAAIARGSLDLEQVSEQLLREDIKIHTLDRYFLGAPSRAGLVFGYGAAEPLQIAHGLERLRQCLTSGETSMVMAGAGGEPTLPPGKLGSLA